MATTSSKIAKTTIVVKAYGTAAAGTNAHFDLLVDGKKVGEATATGSTKDYAFTTDISADAAHTVQIRFDNDAYVNGQDRNLFVKSIMINGRSVSPTDKIVTYDKGALDGKDVRAGQSAMPWDGTLVVAADKSFFPATATTTPAPPPAPAPDTIATTVVVNAKGTEAAGVNAHFNVLIDGKKIGEGTAGTSSKDFTFKADVAKDQAHKVQIQFDNDALIDGRDRNLIVNKITINGDAVNPTDAIVNYDKGALDGQSVIDGRSTMSWDGTLVVNAGKAFFDGTATAPTPTPPPAPKPPAPTPPSDPDSVSLVRKTSAVKSERDGQVIENIDLYVKSGDALTVTHDNVVIRNCRIHHESGDGIYLRGAENVRIENVEVINASPPVGLKPETSTEIRNIFADNSPDLTIRNVTVREGSSGIYLYKSPGADIAYVDGYNFNGPFPRGQFVQFNGSGDATLSDFYAYNDPKSSWVEDIVSVFKSPNVRISDGVIDGNNSKTGVGVMFEAGSTGGRVTNVDVVHQGNGGFSSYNGDVIFRDTRSFDNIWGDQGRGNSPSDALIWNISSNGVSIIDSTYTDAGNPSNIAWNKNLATVLDVDHDPGATVMAHFSNDFDWATA